MTILNILLYIALAAVTVILAVGIFSLMRGGKFAASNSNKLMRLRVLFQFIAVLLLLAAFWFKQQNGG